MALSRRPYGLFHIGFLTLFGALGIATLLCASIGGQLPLFGNQYAKIPLNDTQSLLELVACFCMMAISRLLAFRLYLRLRIALDTIFYVATYFVFGTLAAAWLVFVVFLLDGLIREIRGSGPAPRDEAPLRFSIAHVVYNGGLPAFCLLIVGTAFGDHAVTSYTDAQLLLYITLFYLYFLALYYFLAGITSWFFGNTAARLGSWFFSARHRR